MKKNYETFGVNTSIILNTYNRQNLLMRTCRILQELHFGGQLIICDASEGEIQERIFDEINSYKCTYEITYLNIPKKGDWFYVSMNKCFEAGLKKINRSYALLCFEDDIPIPKTLAEMENFLDVNPDFSSCMGRQIWFNHRQNITKLKSRFVSSLNILSSFLIGERVGENESGADIISPNAVDRIRLFTKRPAHYLFALQRSNGLENIIANNFSDFDDEHSHISTEYHYWFFTVARGNVKYFHKPYILKTCHDGNLSHPDRLVHLPIFTKVLKPNWSRNIELFRKNLLIILLLHDPTLPPSKAADVIEEYIVFYMRHRTEEPTTSSILVQKLKAQIFRSSKRIRLEILFLQLSYYLKLSKAILSAEEKKRSLF